MQSGNSKTKIVVVGGGAGGLELIARLCNKYKPGDNVDLTLVDRELKHIWKPLFHEVASGTFANQYEAIDYISYAYENAFRFVLGEVKAINRITKTLSIAPFYSNNKELIVPERALDYDLLILAVGSKVNDFNTPGVLDHCLLLDTLSDAEQCYQFLLERIICATQGGLEKIDVSIVGAGATGVELAAELNYVLAHINKYGHKLGNYAYTFQVTVIEAADQILSMLPNRVSKSVSRYLQVHNIKVLLNKKVTGVQKNGLITADGGFIESQIIIWAAGIKGNTLSIKHDLELNKLNQFMVKPTLQTITDDSIFSIGDCASCPQADKTKPLYFVPPRAQAAHQQAKFLANSIDCYLQKKSLPNYHYKDYGSIIILSRYNVIGNLMSKITKNFYIEGMLARFAYWLLYKKHLFILLGYKRVLMDTISGLFRQGQRPEIKLH